MEKAERFTDISRCCTMKISDQAIVEATNLIHADHDGHKDPEDDKRSPMLKAQPKNYHMDVRKWLVKRIQEKQN